MKNIKSTRKNLLLAATLLLAFVMFVAGFTMLYSNSPTTSIHSHASETWDTQVEWLPWYIKYSNADTYGSTDVFRIYTAHELAAVAYMTNYDGYTFEGKTVRLMNDIDLDEFRWVPIASANIGLTFRGILDGNGFKITNFEPVAVNDKIALIADVSGKAVIKDLTLYGQISIEPAESGNPISAAPFVASIWNGTGSKLTIDNCQNYVEFDTSQATSRINLAGITSADPYSATNAMIELTRCVNYSDISNVEGMNVTAGIAVSATYISDCANYGNISGGANAAGIVGQLAKGTVRNSYNAANVNITDGRAGGIVASITSKEAIEIYNCVNFGNITGSTTGEQTLGGIVGFVTCQGDGFQLDLLNSANCGSVGSARTSSSVRIGGIIGIIRSYTTSRETSFKNLVSVAINKNGSQTVGGIVGLVQISSSPLILDHCFIKENEAGQTHINYENAVLTNCGFVNANGDIEMYSDYDIDPTKDVFALLNENIQQMQPKDYLNWNTWDSPFLYESFDTQKYGYTQNWTLNEFDIKDLFLDFKLPLGEVAIRLDADAKWMDGEKETLSAEVKYQFSTELNEWVIVATDTEGIAKQINAPEALTNLQIVFMEQGYGMTVGFNDELGEFDLWGFERSYLEYTELRISMSANQPINKEMFNHFDGTPTEYSVTYQNKNGDTITSSMLREGKRVTAIDSPTISGQVFSHWAVVSGNPVGEPITQNTVLRAVYKNAVTAPAERIEDYAELLYAVTDFDLSNISCDIGTGSSLDIRFNNYLGEQILNIEFTKAEGVQTFEMRDYLTGEYKSLDLRRVFVGGSDVVILTKSDSEFARFPISGAVNIKTVFGEGISATLEGTQLGEYYVQENGQVTTKTRNLNVSFLAYRDSSISGYSVYPTTILELSAGRKITFEPSLWENPINQEITPRVRIRVFDQTDNYLWVENLSAITSLLQVGDGVSLSSIFLSDNLINLYQDGSELIIVLNSSFEQSILAVDMKQSETITIYADSTNSSFAPQISVIGVLISEGLNSFNWTILGLDDEVLYDEVLSRNTLLRTNEVFAMFESYRPGMFWTIRAESGNQLNSFLTEDTVWRLIYPYNLSLSFKLTDDDYFFPMLEIPYGSTVTAKEFPAFLGYIPTFFRFSHWETSSGEVLNESLVIRSEMTFYPKVISDYTLDTHSVIPEMIHHANSYNNDDLTKHFTESGYMTAQDEIIQSRSNPVALTSLQILEFRFPYGKDLTYFEIEISGKILRLSSASDNAVLEFGLGNEWEILISIPASLWEVRETGKSFPGKPGSIVAGDPDRMRWNQFTFTLGTKGVDVKWVLEWGLSDKSTTNQRDGLIPFLSHFLPDQNDKTIAILGITDVCVYPWSSGQGLDYWEDINGFAFWATVTMHGDRVVWKDLNNYFPDIRFEGFEAIGLHKVELFLEDMSLGDVAVLPHSFPGYPSIPSELQREGETVQWFVDQQMTIPLERYHTGSMFTALYGRYVSARYEVALSFYTLTQKYVSNSAQFYETLTWRTEYQWFNEGDMITADRFGGEQGNKSFYERVAGIEFQGWSEGMGAPASEDIHIKGNYKLPQITIRYFDIDDNLFGDVRQDIELFPMDLLSNQIQLLELQEGVAPPQTDASSEWPGLIFGLARVVRIVLFGGDDNTFNENAESRSEQILESRAIVRRMVLEYSSDNQIFFPITRLDINLENLDKGDYDNANFVVDPVKNPQWRLLNGTPQANNLIYYVDFHDYFSLNSTHNFTLVVNFLREINGWDTFWKNASNFLKNALVPFAVLIVIIVIIALRPKNKKGGV